MAYFYYTVPNIWYLCTLSPKYVMYSTFCLHCPQKYSESLPIKPSLLRLEQMQRYLYYVRLVSELENVNKGHTYYIIFIHSYYTFNVLLLLFCLFLIFMLSSQMLLYMRVFLFIFKILMFSLIFCLFFFRSFIF